MKTTVELDDALYRAAKKMAVDRGTSLREMIEAGLRREMERPGRAGRRRIPQPGDWPQSPVPLELPPDVNLADRTSLWAWIERERGRPRSPGVGPGVPIPGEQPATRSYSGPAHKRDARRTPGPPASAARRGG